MKRLASITQGTSDYDERLWKLLQESGIDKDEFIGLDYFGLVPFFVIAGATVRSDAHAHGDHLHVEAIHVEIDESLEEAFFGTLPQILDDAYADEDEENASN
jgi:hypothetical protein